MGTFGVRRKFGYHQLNFPVWLWVLGCKEPQTRPQDQISHVEELRERLIKNPRHFSSDFLSNPSQSRNDKEATGKGHTNVSLTAEPGSSSFPCLTSLGRPPQERLLHTTSVTGEPWEPGMGMHWREDAKGKPRADNISEQNELGSSAALCYLQLVLGYWPGSDSRVQGEKAP